MLFIIQLNTMGLLCWNKRNFIFVILVDDNIGFFFPCKKFRATCWLFWLVCPTRKKNFHRLIVFFFVFMDLRKRKISEVTTDNNRPTKKNRITANVPLDYKNVAEKIASIKAVVRKLGDRITKILDEFIKELDCTDGTELQNIISLLMQKSNVSADISKIQTCLKNIYAINTNGVCLRQLNGNILEHIFQFIPYASRDYVNLLLSSKRIRRFLSGIKFMGAEYNIKPEILRAEIFKLARAVAESVERCTFKSLVIKVKDDRVADFFFQDVYQQDKTFEIFKNTEELIIDDSLLDKKN